MQSPQGGSPASRCSRTSCRTSSSSPRATGSLEISPARPPATVPDFTQLAPTSTAKNGSPARLSGKRDLAQPCRVVRVETLRLGEREREELTRNHRQQRGEERRGGLR